MKHHKSLPTLIVQIIPFLIIFSVGFIWLSNWIKIVDPFPDRDSINQFYFPFLNYLKASKFVSAEPSFITEICFSGSYPSGSAIFPWLISLIGLQDTFIDNPFLLYTLFLFLIAAIPYYFNLNNHSRLQLGLLILALPIVQISLKGFSLHTFNVLFAVIALLSFRSYLALKKLKYLAIFILCFWISVICKHLGAFYLFNFAFTFLIYSIYSKKIDIKVPLALLIISIASLPFYPLQNLKDYLLEVITHNPHISLYEFFSIGFIFVAIATSILYFISKHASLGLKPRLCKGPLISSMLTIFAGFLCTIQYDAYTGNKHVIVFFFLGYSFLAWLISHYNLKNSHGFFYLFCTITYINSTLLYCSLIGKTFYIFFLPIILIAILEYLDTESLLKRLSSIFLALIVSNFFPSLEEIQKSGGDRGEDIYVNAFNSLYVNPLGWERCEIPNLRRELVKIFSTIKMNEVSNFYIIENLHFQTKLSLEFPENFFYSFSSIYRLDDLPTERLMELKTNFNRQRINTFLNWIEKKRVSFFILGTRPFTTNIEIAPNLEIFFESQTHDIRSFAESLGTAYIQYLKTNQILNKLYSCVKLPNKNPRLKICVLKSAQLNNPIERHWNSYLQKIATDYEMEQTRPLPYWIKNLDEGNRARLLQKKAGTLYGELELESKSLSFEKKVYRLKKILELDPNHSGAKQDLNGLVEEFNNPKISDDTESFAAENTIQERSSAEKIFNLFKKANDQMEKNNWLEARKLLKQGLEIDPNHTEMLKDLEIVNNELKNLQLKKP